MCLPSYSNSLNKIKRCFFKVGYWLVHFAGIFPVALKISKKEDAVLFHDPKITSWTPWAWSRRSILIGFSQILVTLYDNIRRLKWNADDLNLNEKSRSDLSDNFVNLAKTGVVLCSILTAMAHGREIEKLLNNVCSLYFTVFKRTDTPEIAKFIHLIIYVISSLVVIAFLVITTKGSSTANFIYDFLWRLPYMLTIFFFEIVLSLVLIYLQSAVEGFNRELKGRFPHVDEWNWKYWEAVQPCREENLRREDLETRAKAFLQDCRLAYRTVGKIVDQVNSVYGFPLLLIVILNQTECLLLVFNCNSLLSTNSTTNFSEGGSYQRLIELAVACAWRFVRISVIFHRFEMVVREIQLTAYYIASIDASKIDEESKMELLEFLEEIDGSNFRFMASNIFALDYPNLYLILSSTLTYIIIAIQYLSI